MRIVVRFKPELYPDLMDLNRLAGVHYEISGLELIFPRATAWRPSKDGGMLKVDERYVAPTGWIEAVRVDGVMVFPNVAVIYLRRGESTRGLQIDRYWAGGRIEGGRITLPYLRRDMPYRQVDGSRGLFEFAGMEGRGLSVPVEAISRVIIDGNEVYSRP